MQLLCYDVLLFMRVVLLFLRVVLLVVLSLRLRVAVTVKAIAFFPINSRTRPLIGLDSSFFSGGLPCPPAAVLNGVAAIVPDIKTNFGTATACHINNT